MRTVARLALAIALSLCTFALEVRFIASWGIWSRFTNEGFNEFMMYAMALGFVLPLFLACVVVLLGVFVVVILGMLPGWLAWVFTAPATDRSSAVRRSAARIGGRPDEH